MKKRTLCNPNYPTEEKHQPKQPCDTYDINEEPIVISKPTIDLFLEQDKPGDLMALYQFYYYTAKWQKTNQPKCTTGYAATGLKWSEDRARRTKKILKKLELIEDLITKGETGKIKNHYIKINFIWSKKKIQTTGNHTLGKPEYGNPHTLGNPEGNALSSNNRNALSSNKEKRKDISLTDKKITGKTKKPSIKERNEKYLPLAMHLARTIQSNKNIKFSVNQINSWSNEARQLVEASGVTYSRIQNALDWYEIHINDQYVPVIESGATLRSKFIKLEAAIERDQTPSRKSRNLGRARSDDAPYPIDCRVEE